jgi:hypothetical protein
LAAWLSSMLAYESVAVMPTVSAVVGSGDGSRVGDGDG